ncbi:hypothetical protein POTOM_047538 [Populus tomentosa]|uniref:DUF4283 domain-containing protein n=1 Tax=Populus tomentosa TaxID=118781 RepID=A0A8X7YFQ3_POPTO|nr:hypothetical protein POTOM_047538 [Populus tomentosa]
MEVEFMEREPFCNTIPDKPSDGNRLVMTEFENGNRLLPKIFLGDKNRLWQLTGGFDLMDAGHGYFLVKFDLEYDRWDNLQGNALEIYLNLPVAGKVWIRDHRYRLEYEGLRIICGGWGCYCHHGRSCPLDNKNDSPEKMSGRDSTTAIETNHKGAVNLDNPAKEAVQLGESEFHGEWLVVSRNTKSNSMSNKGDSIKGKYSTKINNKLGRRMISQLGFRRIMGFILQALMGGLYRELAWVLACLYGMIDGLRNRGRNLNIPGSNRQYHGHGLRDLARDMVTEHKWSWSIKLQAPERIRNLVCLIFHDKLPANGFYTLETCCKGLRSRNSSYVQGRQCCADYLAKLAAKGSNALIIWDSPPPGMNHLLQADLTGLCFSRAS